VTVQQLVQPQLDGGQQVVEVVRDAAGQLADGLHLLGLGQLQLDLLLLGHVDQIDDQSPFGLVQIEVGDAGRVARQAHLERTGLAAGQTGLGLVAGDRLDQLAEQHTGLGGGTTHGQQGRIGFKDARVEGVQPLQQGRAERRGAGEGVQRTRRRRFGLDHRRGRDFGGDGFGRRGRRQADQQATAGQARDGGDAIGAVGAQDPLGHLALAGANQGGEQAGARHALGQAAGIAHDLPPRRVGGQQATVGGDQGGRLAQGVDEAFGGVQVALVMGRGSDGDQTQYGHAGDAAQQQQTGQGGGSGAHGRHGRQARRQDKEDRRPPDQGVEPALHDAVFSDVLDGQFGHGRRGSLYCVSRATHFEPFGGYSLWNTRSEGV
jgi:hypothetical protein